MRSFHGGDGGDGDVKVRDMLKDIVTYTGREKPAMKRNKI